MANIELIPHLFRTEYRKIVSVLVRRFGFEQIETAEDIASETFLTAVNSWGINGVPGNPAAWLYHVAKNLAKNHLRRVSTFNTDVIPVLTSSVDERSETDIDLSEHNIHDSQLRMMFALCHPSLSSEAQIGLSLRILCGFGIDEIADAFLTSKETINKRLFRAKELLRKEKCSFELPADHEIDRRLENVLTTIYLLFNEGYYSTSNNTTIRKDLCFEAMRLCTMLAEYGPTNKPQVSALLALMCFHASRFDARTGSNGELVLYNDQDVSLWNGELIGRGAFYLNRAATGDQLSKYHLEAAIAYWHTQKDDTKKKWEQILQLYNKLLQIEYSPIAALNRTYALAKANGKQEAIIEAEKLQLTDNQFYFALMGELYGGIDDEVSKKHFRSAYALAKTENDRQLLKKKMI